MISGFFKKPLVQFVSFLTIVVLVIPSFSGFGLYRYIQWQPDNQWQSIMPSAMYAEPQQNLSLVIITSNQHTAIPWDISAPSYYTYPTGKQFWLALLTKPTVPDSDGRIGLGFYYAVEANGDIFTASCRKVDHQRCLNQAAPVIPWEPITPEIQAQIKTEIQSGVVLVESEAVYHQAELMLPYFTDQSKVIYFADAFQSPTSSSLQQYSANSILRIAVLVSIGIMSFLIFAYLGRRFGVLQWTIAALGTIVIGLSPIVVVMLLGPIHEKLFHILPYLYWLIFFSITVAIAWYHRQQSVWKTFSIDSIWRIFRDNFFSFFFVGVAAGVIFQRFLGPEIAHGDAIRYFTGAMFIYDDGAWLYESVKNFYGHTSLLANYPPGPAIIIAGAMWAAAVDPAAMFFPGKQTTALLYLYTTAIILLHLLVVIAVSSLIKEIRPTSRFAWLVALIILYIIVPTFRGVTYAAEAISWPLFTACVVALLVWAKTLGSRLALYISCGLIAVFLLMKQEDILLLVMLLLPTLIFIYPAGLRWTKQHLMSTGLVGLMSLIPFALFVVQKKVHGIFSAVYSDLSLSGITEQIPVLTKLIYDSSNWLLLNRSGQILFVSLLLLEACMFRQADTIQFWRKACLFFGIVGYYLILITTYLFSTEPDIWLHYSVSWDRIAIYPIIVVVILLVRQVMYIKSSQSA